MPGLADGSSAFQIREAYQLAMAPGHYKADVGAPGYLPQTRTFEAGGTLPRLDGRIRVAPKPADPWLPSVLVAKLNRAAAVAKHAEETTQSHWLRAAGRRRRFMR